MGAVVSRARDNARRAYNDFVTVLSAIALGLAPGAQRLALLPPGGEPIPVTC
jgi:hypothetical protein